MFQSPSLRGSGRFGSRNTNNNRFPAAFQSPSLRGSGRLERGDSAMHGVAVFQSPSLRGSGRFARGGGYEPSDQTAFQSPSLRGSGRFIPSLDPERGRRLKFQSPSLRGSGRFIGRRGQTTRRMRVSIPFIAGQWSLPEGGWGTPPPPLRFNPLHCGAVVASRGRRVPVGVTGLVSIPFIAGQWSLQGGYHCFEDGRC